MEAAWKGSTWADRSWKRLDGVHRKHQWSLATSGTKFPPCQCHMCLLLSRIGPGDNHAEPEAPTCRQSGAPCSNFTTPRQRDHKQIACAYDVADGDLARLPLRSRWLKGVARLYNLSSPTPSSCFSLLITIIHCTILSKQPSNPPQLHPTKQPPPPPLWIASSRPPTTSRTRSRAPPTPLPRRPTRTSPRTATPVSALGKDHALPQLPRRSEPPANSFRTVSRLPAMPSRTRPASRSTRPRPRPISRLSPTKQPA